jgi:hypothetical protein
MDKVISYSGKAYGKYCKNRFCTICSCIRKAEIINKYLPIIQEWEEPQFLTLTIRAGKEHNLKRHLDGVYRAFNQIKDKHRKRFERGKGQKLMGIKSLECNFNPDKKTYNPHLHLLLPNKEIAELLIDEWLKKWTPRLANRKTQLNIPIQDKENTLIEIVKYGSKIFTEPDLNKKSKAKHPPKIYAAALYNIYKAMKGHRLFERFGFDLPKNTVTYKSNSVYTQNYNEWHYDSELRDWYNKEYDERLTSYNPKKELLYLLENRIDTNLN